MRASHYDEAWPWGHRKSPFRAFGARGGAAAAAPAAPLGGVREAGARVPWVGHTVSHHARQGTVMPLSRYRQRPCVRSTGA